MSDVKLEIDQFMFELEKENRVNPKRPNGVRLLVETYLDGLSVQMYEEGAYAGDEDSQATIELSLEEAAALRDFLNEKIL